jgi:phage terminase large subunit
MHQASRARVNFERLLGIEPTLRAVAWHALSQPEQDECYNYGARRQALVDHYGAGALTMHYREECLAWLRGDDTVTSADKTAWIKRYYGTDADSLADFIHDWGYTIDPRIVQDGHNPVMAFSLFPKQREMIRWMIGCWVDSKPGVVVKSRDVGASWVAMALLCTLCIFRKGFAAGVGSAVEIKIDRSGDPDTLFYKVRSFLEYLPPEFNGGFDAARHSADKRVSFPLTGSSITGEAGDQAGRGGRKSIFIVDESAHFEHPKIIDKNLSANTKCRIDMSSVNGMANSFYTRAHNPAIRNFMFTWRDDPRKNTGELNVDGMTWYEQQQAELDPITLRQEVDCDWRASLEGACIDAEHVKAAIGFDAWYLAKTGIDLRSGAKRAALDIADRGNDKNAFVIMTGQCISFAKSWSGKNSDTGYTVQRAISYCESEDMSAFDYDADGMGGAAVHSDMRLINEARGKVQATMKTPKDYFSSGPVTAHPYRGSEAVVRPEALVPGTKRKAKDFFVNRKAQSWYTARLRFWNTWKCRNDKPYDANMLVSIDDGIPERDLLAGQLSQATVVDRANGKIEIDKNPDDVSSPDLADAVVMCLAPRKSTMVNMNAVLASMGGPS